MQLPLRQRFLMAARQFLTAFTIGQEALDAFAEDWTALCEDFTTASTSQEVDAETKSLAHATASCISVLAHTFLALDQDSSQILKAMRSSLDDILSEVCNQDCAINGVDLPSQSLNSVAKQWLLQNLSDPYPSNATKAEIAEGCGCSVRDVRDWFSAVRREIGWSALLQERFGGSRRSTSEAATRTYAERGACSSLPTDIQRAFMTIEANAYALFTHGSLSDSRTLLDVSEEESDEDSRSSSSPPSLHNNNHSFPAVTSLVTSPISLPVDEEDTTPPPPVAGSKRRLDVSTEIEGGDESALSFTARPSKRHRHTSLTMDASLIAPFLLSQFQTTSRSTSEASERTSCGANPASVLVSSPPRKRRLSDAFVSSLPKRPRGISVPRKQVVTDPLPVYVNSAGSEVHEWLQSSFGIPYAAEPDDFDGSLSCDVVLAAQSNEAIVSTPSLDSLVFECHVSDADLVSATPEGFDFSAYNSEPRLASGFDVEHNPDVTTSDGSAWSPSSAGSYSELSDYVLPAHTSNVDWTHDWNQFLNILDTLGSSSPTSSQSSLSDTSPSCPTVSVSTSQPTLDGATPTLFGMDPSFILSDADLVSATPEGFDFSTYNSDVQLASGFDVEHHLCVTTSQSSLSDTSPSYPTVSVSTSQPTLDGVTPTLFGMDSSFISSDVFSDIGGFPSLHMPLEAIV